MNRKVYKGLNLSQYKMKSNSFKLVDNLKINKNILKPETALTFGDDRGYFTAINFESKMKRAYFIRNHKAGTIRAFHGHKKETKTLYCLKGAFKVICISMKTKEWKQFTITEKGNNVLKIPPGVYNGFVSLTDDSELLVLSSSTFKESKNDDFRIPYDTLGKEVWGVDHR